MGIQLSSCRIKPASSCFRQSSIVVDTFRQYRAKPDQRSPSVWEAVLLLSHGSICCFTSFAFHTIHVCLPDRVGTFIMQHTAVNVPPACLSTSSFSFWLVSFTYFLLNHVWIHSCTENSTSSYMQYVLFLLYLLYLSTHRQFFLDDSTTASSCFQRY
jgi:hypothetical protein